jgi:hypothetical protein
MFSSIFLSTPQKTGSHPFTVKFQGSGLLEESMQIEVTPGDAVKLEVPHPLKETYFVNGQTISDSIEVHLADDYDNLVSLGKSGLQVEMSLIPDSSVVTKEVPDLVGKVKEHIKEGIVVFRNIKIGDRRATSGVYKLNFTAKNMASTSLELFYQNGKFLNPIMILIILDSEDVAYRTQIQQKLMTANKAVSETKTKIDKVKQFMKQKSRDLDSRQVTFEELKKQFFQLMQNDNDDQSISVIEELISSSEKMEGVIKSMESRIADMLKQVTLPVIHRLLIFRPKSTLEFRYILRMLL